MIIVKIILGIALYFGAMISISLAVETGIMEGLRQFYKGDKK